MIERVCNKLVSNFGPSLYVFMGNENRHSDIRIRRTSCKTKTLMLAFKYFMASFIHCVSCILYLSLNFDIVILLLHNMFLS